MKADIILDSMGSIPDRYLEEALDTGSDGDQERNGKKGWRRLQRLGGLAACFALILGLGIALGVHGTKVYGQTTSYLSVDVNPSIEICLNKWNKVVDVIPCNEDGERICRKLKLESRDYQEAFECLLKDDDFSSYLSNEADLTVTIVSDCYDKLCSGIERVAADHACGVAVCQADEATLKEAHQQDCSLGKYMKWQELCQYDDDYELDDCKEMTMHQLNQEIQKCREEGFFHSADEELEHHQEVGEEQHEETEDSEHHEEAEDLHHEEAEDLHHEEAEDLHHEETEVPKHNKDRDNDSKKHH